MQLAITVPTGAMHTKLPWATIQIATGVIASPRVDLAFGPIRALDSETKFNTDLWLRFASFTGRKALTVGTAVATLSGETQLIIRAQISFVEVTITVIIDAVPT